MSISEITRKIDDLRQSFIRRNALGSVPDDIEEILESLEKDALRMGREIDLLKDGVGDLESENSDLVNRVSELELELERVGIPTDRLEEFGCAMYNILHCPDSLTHQDRSLLEQVCRNLR